MLFNLCLLQKNRIILINLPFVSVIIPTYNYGHFITDAINSVLQQDYPMEKIEILVVDDGSTDNTKEVLKEFITKNVIRYFYQENKGKTNATFNAIQNCNGKYIFNLDADDYFFEDKIRASVDIFESDESIVHVASPAKHILQGGTYIIEPIPKKIIGKPLDGKWLLRYLMNANLLYGGGSTYAARASILRAINMPDAIDMYTDEFLVLATLPHGKSFFIDKSLSVWRGHNLNYSGTSKTPSIRMLKEKRMLSSCNAVFEYLRQKAYDKELVRIYWLKNLTNNLSFKESFHQKKYKDILKYAYAVFFKIRPKPSLIKNYHVINRLVPTSLFVALKRIFVGTDKRTHYTE